MNFLSQLKIDHNLSSDQSKINSEFLKKVVRSIFAGPNETTPVTTVTYLKLLTTTSNSWMRTKVKALTLSNYLTVQWLFDYQYTGGASIHSIGILGLAYQKGRGAK